MAVSAIFHDGSMVTGSSFYELELALRADEWNPSKKRKFRDQFALRAWNWSRTPVQEEGKSKRFLKGLEKAGILRLEVTADE